MNTLHQESVETKVSAPERALDATDRCDSCGAQAYVRAVVAGSELLFCAHHARKHESKLKEVASSWHDETDRLYAHS
ncbi:MAG: DUF7455 domain-containing protein [Canibacter sp.]